MTAPEDIINHPTEARTASPSPLPSIWPMAGILLTTLVLLDQLTKWLVDSRFTLYESISVFGDWLRFTYIRNPGGAFGVRWGHEAVYYGAATLVILWIIWHLFHEGRTRRLSSLALVLILSGAVGNLIDRVLRGEVIDFIDAEFFDLTIPSFDIWLLHHPGYAMDRWPTFNIADSAVTIGVCCLLVSLWWDPLLVCRRGTGTIDTAPSVGMNPA